MLAAIMLAVVFIGVLNVKLASALTVIAT